MLTANADAQENTLKLSVKDAVKFAVERNLDVKTELYNPAQAEADIRKNRAIYETHLTADTSYNQSTTYSPSLGGGVDQKEFNFTPGAYKLLPTGGTVNLSFDNSYKKNSVATTLGSYWESMLNLSLSQPLLKNFGRDSTELNIKVAELSKDASVKRFKTKLLTVVAQVNSEYFLLHSLKEDLVSKRTSLELAQRILKETEARVKAGVLPAMEILNAQFGVSSREKDTIDAEKAVKDQEDILRVLLQLDGSAEIIPTDAPNRTEYTLNEDDAIKKALSGRPELDDLKFQLTSSEIQTRVLKGRTLPDLSLTSSVGLMGLGDTYGRDFERLGSTDYPIWSVGLKLDYPLGNQSAENDFRKSKLRTEQIRTQLEALNSSLASEVRTAIRAVTSSYKQLDVADRGRAYAEERLKAYLKKSEVGLATNKDVLDVENDLSTARTNQIKAQVAYTNALSQYWKSTGELLDREGIKVNSSQADNLYNKSR
ncbi:TolC family protein [Geobacter pelophilus]|uniref:TolC family protein n=2 Tax=Geoanaerobacter pelophilus TaxID=60036 RepID=A0AAW4KZD1_9BACT|nr:TolC family protein [Geoanaerobacter pelophilus]MBT0662910.1 TolC family protein [Geoanaerobacter pelophilus]